ELINWTKRRDRRVHVVIDGPNRWFPQTANTRIARSRIIGSGTPINQSNAPFTSESKPFVAMGAEPECVTRATRPPVGGLASWSLTGSDGIRTGLYSLVLTRFLYANRSPPTDQV